MIDTIKYATISNIYVKDLIFFDENKEEALKKLCFDYGISYLPNRNRRTCYKLENGIFKPTELTEDLVCNPYDRLFEDETIKKFENGRHDEVMFVVEEGKIKGVVHIVDYNTEFINYEFYKATYRLEKMLRDLLIKNGETNDSLLEWMRQKANKKIVFWENRYSQCVPNSEERRKEQVRKRKECNPFQTFFFNDLLMFTASKKYVSKDFRKNIEILKEIRNWVAHNKDLAPKNREESHPLYCIDGLKKFVKGARNFFKCYEELEELIR
jgi:hypothetical protein